LKLDRTSEKEPNVIKTVSYPAPLFIIIAVNVFFDEELGIGVGGLVLLEIESEL